MTSMPPVFIIFFYKNWIFHQIFGCFEILLFYPNVESPHWLAEVHLIKNKNLRDKFMVLMASTVSSHTFLIKFLFLPVLVVVFLVIRQIVMTY